MSIVKASWSSFDDNIAKIYLNGWGHPSERSKHLMASVLLELYGDRPFHLADFGGGNGHLYGFFRERGLNLRYTGFDFSPILLQAGRERFSGDDAAQFRECDIQEPDENLGVADIVLYSHVLEMLESPGASLALARKMAPRIMIRFFEPPAERHDLVQIRMLDVGRGEATMPYLRRSMSMDFYQLMLSKLGGSSVDIHRVGDDKDEVHVIGFSTSEED